MLLLITAVIKMVRKLLHLFAAIVALNFFQVQIFSKGDFRICFLNNSTTEFVCSSNNSGFCKWVHLEDLKTISSNTVVLAFRDHYTLDFVISIESAINVAIIGSHNGTVFNCSRMGGMLIADTRSSIFLCNVTFANCGSNFSKWTQELTEKYNESLMMTIFIVNTSRFILERVQVVNGSGVGLTVVNSGGSLSYSTFASNFARNHTTVGFGGGVSVEFNDKYQFDKILISIVNCSFIDNRAERLRFNRVLCESTDTTSAVNRGGGLAVVLKGKLAIRKAVVEILNCVFENNYANWGGGMFILLCIPYENTSVSVSKTQFINNLAEYGGGGLDLGLKDFTKALSEHTIFLCQDCFFKDNRAYFGGGHSIFTNYIHKHLNLTIVFMNSSWISNRANFGMAVDLRPEMTNNKLEATVSFCNSTFKENKLKRNASLFSKAEETCSMGHIENAKGRGILLVTGLKVRFDGSVHFIANSDSGIYAISSSIYFSSGANVMFQTNHAVFGAAMALIGFSTIYVDRNVTVYMQQNSATAIGGAIYHESINKHDSAFSIDCFIQTKSDDHNDITDWAMSKQSNTGTGVHFYFMGNKAGTNFKEGHFGNSIFATTLKPCFSYCNGFQARGSALPFQCIGQFHYDEPLNHTVSTRASCMVLNQRGIIDAVPGFPVELPFTNLNDLGVEVYGVYHVAAPDATDFYIDDKSTFTSVKYIKINGKVNSMGNITVTNTDVRESSIDFTVRLRLCPPLFVLHNRTLKCVCFTELTNRHDHKFICNRGTNNTMLIHGFWVGLLGNESDTELYYSYCPVNYCFRGEEFESYHNMPARVEDLSAKICGGSNRRGVLCAKCKENFSTHYHSDSFICGSERTCYYGWILYLLTEVLPMVIVFTIVIGFKVSFTSGHLNGFLLFAQTYDSLYVIGKSLVYYPTPAYRLFQAIRVAYKFFNLDFFGINELSFCLWKGSTTLQMTAFKYVTVLIAFLLVYATIYFFGKFTALNKLLKYSKGSSVTHGLSTFLIMVYMQSTKVSFDILIFGYLHDLKGDKVRAVVFYQGDVSPFSKEHAPFAVLALLSLMFITIIPPFFLLVYPSATRLSSMPKLLKINPFTCLSKIPMFRLKPLFDAFQSTFKDKNRYFAGLYFGYRMILLLATILTPKITQTFLVIQIVLMLMVTLQALHWPYKERAHNVTNTLVFFILSSINAISLMNHNYSMYGETYQSKIDVLAYVLVVLAYLPLLCVIGFVVQQCYQLLKIKQLNTDTEKPKDDEIVLNMLDDRGNEESLDYLSFSYD